MQGGLTEEMELMWFGTLTRANVSNQCVFQWEIPSLDKGVLRGQITSHFALKNTFIETGNILLKSL